MLHGNLTRRSYTHRQLDTEDSITLDASMLITHVRLVRAAGRSEGILRVYTEYGARCVHAVTSIHILRVEQSVEGLKCSYTIAYVERDSRV